MLGDAMSVHWQETSLCALDKMYDVMVNDISVN